MVDKEETAISISKEINDHQKILSYGCGIGYVEKVLTELNPTIEIFAFDFSDNSSKWIKNKFPNVTHVNNIEASEKFDLIYLCQLLYAISHQDCVKLLKKLTSHLKPNGKILLVNTSIIPSENGEIERKKNTNTI